MVEQIVTLEPKGRSPVRARFVPAPVPVRRCAVLLHGVRSHGGFLVPLADALSAGGVSVLILDRRGSGLNRDCPGAFDPSAWLDDVRCAIARAREEGSTSVVGWCFGARLALWAALEIDGVDRVFLIAPGLAYRPDVVAAMRAFEQGAPSAAYDVWADTDDEAVQERIRHDESKWDSLPAEFPRANRALLEAVRGAEERLRRPAYVLLAEGDRTIDNAAVRERCAQNARIELDTIPGGHAIVLENPTEVAARILARWPSP